MLEAENQHYLILPPVPEEDIAKESLREILSKSDAKLYYRPPTIAAYFMSFLLLLSSLWSKNIIDQNLSVHNT